MFTSSGIVRFDPLKGSKHHEPWWCLLECDKQVAEYYAWLIKRYGLPVNTSSPWGTHISIIKGETVPNPSQWGKLEGAEIEFHYNHWVRFDNGQHAWVDVYSEDLAAVRESVGLPFKPWYHLTVGRLERTWE